METKKQLVESLIRTLGFDQFELELTDGGEETIINLTLPQEDSGILIGFRGEKIDALQCILNLMLNQDAIAFKPINLDVNQYHQKRHQQLEVLADSAAEKAISSGREILLPPMSPNERRLIHLHLSTSTTVSTYSEGEGSSRRIVVRPKQ